MKKMKRREGDYSYYIENCDQEGVLDRLLKDPLYRLSSSIDSCEIYGLELGGTFKYVASISLGIEVDDDDDDDKDEEVVTEKQSQNKRLKRN